MNAQLSMFSPATSPDSPNAISSPESADGRSPPASQDGPTTASCGPVARPASRSQSLGKAKPKLTNGTCGPTYFASPVPDGPLFSWESRLRQRLARIGSTECLLTWKASVTPAGRSLSRLVPSMHLTEGIDSGLSRETALWPTPASSLADKAVRTQEGARKEVERGKSPDLNARVMALWPTPCARDHMPAHTAEYVAAKKAQGHGMSVLPDYAAMALWPTPRASANENRTTKIPPSQMDGRHGLYLSSAAIGATTPGSSDTTEKPGALAPAFVGWLMGFPPEWEDCAPATMPRRSKR